MGPARAELLPAPCCFCANAAKSIAITAKRSTHFKHISARDSYKEAAKYAARSAVMAPKSAALALVKKSIPKNHKKKLKEKKRKKRAVPLS